MYCVPEPRLRSGPLHSAAKQGGMRARVGAGAAGAMRDRGRTAGRARGSQMDQSPTTCQMVQARTELTEYSAARLAVLPCPVYRTGAARAKSFASGTPGPSRCATPGLRASSTSEGLTSGCRPRAVKATLSCPHRTALHRTTWLGARGPELQSCPCGETRNSKPRSPEPRRRRRGPVAEPCAATKTRRRL